MANPWLNPLQDSKENREKKQQNTANKVKFAYEGALKRGQVSNYDEYVEFVKKGNEAAAKARQNHAEAVYKKAYTDYLRKNGALSGAGVVPGARVGDKGTGVSVMSAGIDRTEIFGTRVNESSTALQRAIQYAPKGMSATEYLKNAGITDQSVLNVAQNADYQKAYRNAPTGVVPGAINQGYKAPTPQQLQDKFPMAYANQGVMQQAADETVSTEWLQGQIDIAKRNEDDYRDRAMTYQQMGADPSGNKPIDAMYRMVLGQADEWRNKGQEYSDWLYRAEGVQGYAKYMELLADPANQKYTNMAAQIRHTPWELGDTPHEYDTIAVNEQGNGNKVKITEDIVASGRQTQENYEYMTEDEKKVYNILWAKDKANGTNEADRFLELLAPKLNQRHMEAIEAAAAENANRNPVGATLGAIIATPFNLVGATELAAQRLSGKRIDPNSDAFMLTAAKEKTYGTVSENIANSVDSEAMKKVLPFLYQTSTSIGESAVARVASMGQGWLSLLMMGAGAATSAHRDALQRGATQDEAAGMALSAGIAEALFEMVSLDSFVKIKNGKGVTQWVKNLLKQGGVEASEEFATEIANKVADSVIMDENSNFNIAVQNYIEQGMTEEQARAQAWRDQGKDILAAAVGGFISGGVSGAYGSAYNDNVVNKQYKEMGKSIAETNMAQPVIDAALRQSETSESHKLAAKMQGGQVSNRELGELAFQLMAEGADFESIINNREVINETATPGTPTNQQKRSIWQNSEITNGVNRRYSNGRVQMAARRMLEAKGEKVTAYNLAMASRGIESQIKVLDDIGKKFGLDIVVVDSIAYKEDNGYVINSALNGAYDPKTGRVFVAMDAQEGALMYVGMHEIAHALKATNEAAYNELDKFVAEYLNGTDKTMDSLIKGQQERFGYTPEEAREEVISNTLPAILADEKMVYKIAGTKFGRRLYNKLTGFQKSLNDTVARLSKLDDWQQIDILKNDVETINKMVEMFEKGMAERSNEIVGGDVKKSMVGFKAKANDPFGKVLPKIKEGTGWFIGKDGMLRFEISDKGARVREGRIYKALNEVAAESVKNHGDVELTLKLSDILVHEELFRLYPNMRNAIVRITNNKNKIASANDKGVITLGQKIRTKADNFKGVLLHEVQHWIQAKEGFAQGGNPTFGRKLALLRIAENINKREYAKLQSKNERLAYLLNSAMLAGKTIKELGRQAYRGLHGEIEAGYTDSRKEYTQQQLRKDKYENMGDVLYEKGRVTEAFNALLDGDVEAYEKYKKESAAKLSTKERISGIVGVRLGDDRRRVGGNNENILPRFSKKTEVDSLGNDLSAEQQEYFKDSKVRDAEGRLRVVWHGSGANFNVFSHDFISMHGSMEGQGFYFTDKKSMAEGYQKKGGKLFEGYLDIKKPLSDSFLTLTRAEVTRLLKTVDPTGDDVVINYDPQGGMGYPSKAWYDRALRATVDSLMNYNETDSELLADLANSGAGPENVLKTVRKELGYDGYIVDNKYDNATVYVAFESNQFKNADNTTPTTNPDTRFSFKTDLGAADRARYAGDFGNALIVPVNKAGKVIPKAAADVEDMIQRRMKRDSVSRERARASLTADPKYVQKVKEAEAAQKAMNERRASTVAVLEKASKMTPWEIAHITEEDANTTPQLTPKNSGKKGDGKSSFYGSAMRSANVADETKALIENSSDIQYYATIANADTLNEANERLNEGGRQEAMRFERIDPKQADATDVAEGFILLKRYQDAGDYDSAIAVLEKLREIGTTAGRTVQAFSILGRLTPEGMQQYAAKTLERAKQDMVAKKGQQWVDNHKEMFSLNADEMRYIRETMERAAQLPEGREKNVLIAQVNAIVQDKLPTNARRMLKAWARNSMLLNAKTMLRNILGNAMMTPQYFVNDVIGSVVDRAVAKKTGVRTTGVYVGKETGKAFVKGAFESFDDFRKHINTRNMEGDRFEAGQGSDFKHYKRQQIEAARWYKKGGMALSNALNAMDRLTGFLLDAGDRPFYEMHFVNSINAQLRANKTTEVTAEMIDIATQDALERTWQDNNGYTKAVKKIVDVLNLNKEYGLGSIIIPFTKTPANLTKALVEYSPVGLVKALAVDARKLSQSIKSGTPDARLQRKFVNNLAKGISGSIVMALAMALAKAGIITGGDEEEDKDVAAFKKNVMGIAPYSVTIDGKSYSYDWAQPIGGLMAIGADIQQYKDGEINGMKALGSAGNAILNALSTGGNVIFEQSFLQGVATLFKEEGLVAGLINAALGMTSQMVPTALQQIAQMADPYQRTGFEYNNVLATTYNNILNKTPGAKNQLASLVDVMGQDVEANNNPLYVMFSPSNKKENRAGDAATEIYRVYQATGNSSVVPALAPYTYEWKGEKYTLSAKERSGQQRQMGGVVTDIVNDLMQNPIYKKMSAEDQGKVIELAILYSNNTAKTNYLVANAGAKDERDGWMKDAEANVKHGLSLADTILIKYATKDIKGDKDASGKTIDGSKAANVAAVIDGMGLNSGEKDYAYSTFVLSDSGAETAARLNIGGVTYYEISTIQPEKYYDGDSVTYSKAHKTAEYIDKMPGGNKEDLYLEFVLTDTQKDKYEKLEGILTPQDVYNIMTTVATPGKHGSGANKKREYIYDLGLDEEDENLVFETFDISPKMFKEYDVDIRPTKADYETYWAKAKNIGVSEATFKKVFEEALDMSDKEYKKDYWKIIDEQRMSISAKKALRGIFD